MGTAMRTRLAGGVYASFARPGRYIVDAYAHKLEFHTVDGI